jgi:dsRNA-specific ribonuclease
MSESNLTQTKIKIINGKTLGQIGLKMNLGKHLIISNHLEQLGSRINPRILEDVFEAFVFAIFIDNGGSTIASKDEWNKTNIKLKELSELINYYENKNIETMSRDELVSFNKIYKEYRLVSDKLIKINNSPFALCQRFIINVIESELDLIELFRKNENYKDQLQAYFQQNYSGSIPKWELLSIQGPTHHRIHKVCVYDIYGYIIGIGAAQKKIDAEQEASRIALEYLTTKL